MRAREALLDLLSAPDGALALIEPESGERTTYGELRATADRLARSLAEAGVGPGDAVAMSLPNGPEIVAAFLAAVAAGAASAPLNQAYTAEEFHAYLDDLQPRAMLFLRGEASPARSACEALGIRRLELVGQSTAELALADVPATGSPPARDPEAVALLLHTSGTTSKPKGVPIRQRNLAASARAVAATYALSGDDASHCAMPLFHVHGLVASTLATLASGGTVIAPRRFSASAFWSDCATYGATWFSAVPTIHRILLSRAEDGALRSRRPPPALRPLLLVGSARPAHGGLRDALRTAARRGLRHDRGSAPDGVEPAAARRAPGRLGRSSDGHGDRDPRRRVAAAERRRRGRGLRARPWTWSTPIAPIPRPPRPASATAGSARATRGSCPRTATSRWPAASRS